MKNIYGFSAWSTNKLALVAIGDMCEPLKGVKTQHILPNAQIFFPLGINMGYLINIFMQIFVTKMPVYQQSAAKLFSILVKSVLYSITKANYISAPLRCYAKE